MHAAADRHIIDRAGGFDDEQQIGIFEEAADFGAFHAAQGEQNSHADI